jgi:hypothetical protein
MPRAWVVNEMMGGQQEVAHGSWLCGLDLERGLQLRLRRWSAQ